MQIIHMVSSAPDVARLSAFFLLVLFVALCHADTALTICRATNVFVRGLLCEPSLRC